MAELIFSILFLILSIGILVWMIYMVVGDVLGAPWVTTPLPMAKQILQLFKFKADRLFVDLGSGDGRMVRLAAKEYGVKGIGMEVNPYLTWWARWKAQTEQLRNVQFTMDNFWKTDLSDVDYFYFYLRPNTVERLAQKLNKEGKKGAIVASRAFEIKSWKKKLQQKTTVNNSRVYIYGI